MHSHPTLTGEDQKPIEGDPSFAILEMETKNRLNKCHFTNMTTLLDKSGLQDVAQVVADSETEVEKVASMVQKFLHHQATDAFCRQAAENIGQRSAEYTIDKNGLIAKMTALVAIIQIVVPQTHQSQFLYHSIFLVVAKPFEQCIMNYSVRGQVY